ncbi:transposable element Tc1 transposase [Trichonephila clavipes]|nr:transposable element Tc1 transposase [Trichonephila clavipes]
MQKIIHKHRSPYSTAELIISRLIRDKASLLIASQNNSNSVPLTRRVAGQVDHSECAVRNCWEQWTREGTHERKTGSGATRKTSRREDRRIVRQALVDPTVTRSTIRADVDVAIVPQTISRHLAEVKLKSKRPFRALPLTPDHRQLRKQWCQSRSMWNVTDWQKVVFSDESRFVLGTDDNRVRVWRRPGPFLNGLPGAIFQQDNGRPHTARFTQDSLRHFSDSSMAGPLPRFVPCRARVGSAKTADAIVSFCT